MWKRASLWWLLLKGDARALWRALRHPQAPGWLKAGSALLLLYLLSPIDLLPDTLPLLGVVDDLVIVTLGIKALLGRLSPELQAHARAGRRPAPPPSPL